MTLRLDEFHGHLANLRHEGLITAWIDREISAGTPTGREATSKLETASLFVPLVSSELLNSRCETGVRGLRIADPCLLQELPP